MPLPDFFTQFGVHHEFDFLSLEICRKICLAFATAELKQGEIWHTEQGRLWQAEIKKRKETALFPEELVSAVLEKLLALKPDIEKIFNIELSGCQGIKFTRYDEGDYYRQHVDTVSEPDAPQELKERRVSVIIFLNQEGDSPDDGDYCGGNLTFYGLLDDPKWQGVGLPLESEAGLLIAFRPDIVHEVTPVTHGSRYTITTWYK